MSFIKPLSLGSWISLVFKGLSFDSIFKISKCLFRHHHLFFFLPVLYRLFEWSAKHLQKNFTQNLVNAHVLLKLELFGVRERFNFNTLRTLPE